MRSDNAQVHADVAARPQAELAPDSVVPVEDNYALTVYNRKLVTQHKSRGENSILGGLQTFFKLMELNYSDDTLISRSIQESRSYALANTLQNDFKSIVAEHFN